MRFLEIGGAASLRRVRRMMVTAGLCAIALGLFASGAQAAQVQGELGFGFTKSAKLEAEIDPQGAETACEAQYVSQQSYEAHGWAQAATVLCEPQSLGSGTAPVHVTVSVPGGLALDTVYEYRFLATSGHTITGAAETFTTFGFEAVRFEDLQGGEPFVTAGGHPEEFNIEYVLNGNWTRTGAGTYDAQMKDLISELPPGLIGDPSATPRCPQRLEEQFSCPADTQIGTIGVGLVAEAKKGRPLGELSGDPLFNLVPPKGVVARFGSVINIGISAYIDAGLRTGSDYGIDAGSFETTSFADVKRIALKMWGVPGAAAHTLERVCSGSEAIEFEKEGIPLSEGRGLYRNSGCPSKAPLKPFLRNPTSCVGPLTVGGETDSYQEPGAYSLTQSSLPGMTGCKAVPFAPSIEARSTTASADSPSGLSLDIHVPQHEGAEEVASSDLKDATVTFPAGLTVNPSSADGLGACSEQQVGFTGFAALDPAAEPGVQTAQFTPGPAECPAASKLGSVTVHTPLLEHPLPGALYLATPHANPFGSLVAVYLTVDDPVSGVVIKLAGDVQLNPQTGQLTSTFQQNPQLPFEDLEIDLFGGKEAAEHSRAVFTTPMACGAYKTTSVLAPWSGAPAVMPASRPFQVTGGPGGGACAATEAQAGNAPGFLAGTSSPIAGTYSPFELSLTREDGSQHFHALNVTLPPGMTGKIAGVEECSQASIEEAQRLGREGGGAAELAHPSCPAGSQVGVVHVGTGSGAPLYVNGRVYFAGPYEGAPFSLVFITPALAGPFDLGTVVVRAALFINPQTAQVTVKSDPFPTILDGIPLDIRSVGVEMTRPGFTLNPTSCNVMAVVGEEISTAGVAAPLSDRFQVGGCGTMPFHPTFTAMTHARHTRAHGEYLHVSIESGEGQANIAKVHVQLPSKLPSELPTLKLACTEAQFDANPAGCPADSVVGAAIARSPILPVPLEGPAMFVSHGGKGFPNLDLVLQGDGVHITLVGDTYINKKQITTSTFKTVPDVPVSRFDLVLPAGEHPALGGNGNMCVKPLYMPTVITGQNGVVERQRTKVSVGGCKPELRVLGHRVRHLRASIRVRVPSAGRLIASGNGLMRAVQRVAGAKVVTITVRLGRHDRRVLAKHSHQRVNAKVKLRFIAKHGHHRALHAHVKALIG